MTNAKVPFFATQLSEKRCVLHVSTPAEHAVLMLRVVILSVSPSMPKWISDVREVLEYRVANRYLTAEHLEAERRQYEEYNAKMNDSVAMMKRQLRNKDRDQLQDLFDTIDQVPRPKRRPTSILRESHRTPPAWLFDIAVRT